MSPEALRTARRPVPGVLVAGVTALVSGVSVFVNSYGVHAVASPAVYTTAKNLVAALVLGLFGVVGWRLRSSRPGTVPANFVTRASGQARPRATSGLTRAARTLGFAYVGVVGGGLAFVLFFEGLARTEPASAAFWRDTLVLWVAVLAIPFLRERVRWWNVLAVVALIAGEVTFTGGIGQLGANTGELLVLASTVLWAIEVVVAKTLLREVAPSALALVRMGVGAATLIAYLVVTGSLHALVALDVLQWRWALWTGLALGAYVGTWMTALARARALDVTSVLVASALFTWLLQVIAGTATPAVSSLGLVLIAVGAALVLWAGLRRSPTARQETSTS